MTGSLEFPYRLKGKVVFGLIVFLAVSLACLAGLGYFFVAGQLSSGDFMGQRGGKALFAIPFVAACDLLILAYLVRMRGAVVRLTDADLTAGASLRGPNTLPIREIQNIDIRQVDNLRVMYVRAGAGIRERLGPRENLVRFCCSVEESSLSRETGHAMPMANRCQGVVGSLTSNSGRRCR
jgi:hypothetical protein